MTQQLARYSDTVRAQRRAGQKRRPLPARCAMYTRLLDRWGSESVLRHLGQIDEALDWAELESFKEVKDVS